MVANNAGMPATPADLINVDEVIGKYYDVVPDPNVPEQRVSFGTSGHRGSSLKTSFNEAHIVAITQAIAEYRKKAGVTGPLYIGRDTHALSEPAWKTAIEVLVANGVTVRIDSQILTRVNTIELKRATGICRGVCAVDALGGKCAAGGKVLESHVAAGKIEDADGMLDRGDVELLERYVHSAHPAGPRCLARIGEGGGVLAIERIVELDER